jgi:site-specific DNA recombinase
VRRQTQAEAAADLSTEWNRPDFTLEQKQAAIVKSVTTIVIHPAPRQGMRFSPDQLAIVWKPTTKIETRPRKMIKGATPRWMAP